MLNVPWVHVPPYLSTATQITVQEGPQQEQEVPEGVGSAEAERVAAVGASEGQGLKPALP